MLNAKSFLALDFGAANLKLAEFEIDEAGGLRLIRYGLHSLGQEGLQEATREAAMRQTLQELLSAQSVAAKNVNVCAPGFHTFSKFVKLPPVDTSKVTQIIQYEAQQNVPFPLEEVVWDYQILGATPTGELEVLLVAIKSDVVEGLFRVAETAGLRPQLVDVSPAALCNSFRYNYPDLEGCTLLLDIGAKTSNLLFFEKGSVYARGINIGANSITQDFSKESRLAWPEAERLKLEQGFVSLGGAYEEPENAHQAAISKIARQVMTRLHIQVNQTVQFYRGQQGGAAPDRLYLSGGASIMPYTAQFFAEKLNVPVEYFNPFRNIQIDENLNLEELAKVAHSMGEVVGLGLRNLAHCPVELNLMPKSSLKRHELNQKKPYFIAAAFCLILVVFAFGWFFDRIAGKKEEALERLNEVLTPYQRNDQILRREMNQVKGLRTELDQYTTWMEDRFYWAGVLTALRDSFMTVEKQVESEFNVKAGLWVERFAPILPSGYSKDVTEEGTAMARGETARPDFTQLWDPSQAESSAAQPDQAPTDAIDTVYLYCRGVDLSATAPAANTKAAFAVPAELQTRTNLFETNGVSLVGEIQTDSETNFTFTFQVKVKLKRPITL